MERGTVHSLNCKGKVVLVTVLVKTEIYCY